MFEYLKDHVHTQRSIWTLPIASVFKVSHAGAREESAAWRRLKKELISIRSVMVTHIFVLLSTTFYGLKCTTLEQPWTKLKPSLCWFRMSLPSVSDSPENLKSFSVSTWATASNIEFSHKRVMAPKRKILEIFTNFEIQAPWSRKNSGPKFQLMKL